jgi:anti-anti-sigma regulatory factor
VIKLTKQSTPSELVIRIEGSLRADTLAELRDLIDSDGRSITLDLAGLESLDSDGLALLVQLRNRGHQLRGGSLYVKQLLEEA